MSDIERVVTQTIAEVAKRDASEVAMDRRLAEDLMLKSVSRIELAALLEDRLHVTISNFDIRRPKTVGDVVEMVKQKS